MRKLRGLALTLALLAGVSSVPAQPTKIARVGYLYFGSRQTGVAPERFCRTVSFFANGLRLAPETFAAALPPA